MKKLLKNIFAYCKYKLTYYKEDDVYQIASTDWNPSLRHNRGGSKGDYISEYDRSELGDVRYWDTKELPGDIGEPEPVYWGSYPDNQWGKKTHPRPSALWPVIWGVVCGLFVRWVWDLAQYIRTDEYQLVGGGIADTAEQIFMIVILVIFAILSLGLLIGAFDSLWRGMHRRDQYWVYRENMYRQYFTDAVADCYDLRQELIWEKQRGEHET